MFFIFGRTLEKSPVSFIDFKPKQEIIMIAIINVENSIMVVVIMFVIMVVVIKMVITIMVVTMMVLIAEPVL